jgi:5-formyltetrahydrofolate cyclo-ligase
MSDKASLRTLYLHRRNLLTSTEYEKYNAQIVETLSVLLRSISFSTVHTFLPQTKKKEIDTLRIISMIRENYKNTRIIVPRVRTGTRQMEHYLLTLESKLIFNRWLIPEPDPSSSEPMETSVIDLVLIPLLAYDERGFRAGYGGGYYDRFLSECRQDTIKIGLSFFDPVDKIQDIDIYDIPMDYCVTPNQVIRFHHLEEC